MEISLTFNNKEKLVLSILKQFGEIKGRTRLQKINYLLKKKYNCPVPFNFIRHHYGPYSEELQESLLNLVRRKMVIESSHYNYSGYSYSLTPLGSSVFNFGLVDLPSSIIAQIQQVHFDGYGTKELQEILNEVYEIAGIAN